MCRAVLYLSVDKCHGSGHPHLLSQFPHLKVSQTFIRLSAESFSHFGRRSGSQFPALLANYLNLPGSIILEGSPLEYIYDAAGKKHRSPGPYDYVNNTHYSPDGFEAVYTDEGRVTPIYNDSLATLDSFQYEWVLRDHLGNGRVYFSDLDKNLGISSQTPQELLQDVHYYPFGLMYEGPFYAQVGPVNEYTYNGKRFHREGDLNWYDYGFRFYDATIARFPSLDPIADDFAHVTPYNYAENNPASGIDLYGLQYIPVDIIKPFYEGFKKSDTYKYLTAPQYDYAAAQEQYDAENNFVPGLGNVDSNAGNQNTTEALGSFADLAPDVLIIATGTNSKATTGSVAATRVTAKAAKAAKMGDTATKQAAAAKIEPVTNAIYKRPNNATTAAQRKSVQGKPCVDCKAVGQKNVADHKTPLVKEHYQTGTIDKTRMKSLEAVQPQCPTCSAKQGAEMSKYSKEMKKIIKNRQD